MAGWVKCHRRITSWEWYTEPLTAHLFNHLILKANHKPGTWKGIELSRGQLITGRIALSRETGLSEQEVRTSLKRLKKGGEITIKSTSRFSIITVCKYKEYQGLEADEQPAQQPAINQQSTSNQPAINHKQECKEGKEGKEVKKRWPQPDRKLGEIAGWLLEK